MTASRTVGLFGGSFNPPHIGHLIIAELVREAFGLDEVLWMPSGRPPHKEAADLAPAEHRLAMTRLAIEGHPSFRVSAWEVEREEPSFTLYTVEALQATHPNEQLVLVVGGDSWTQLHTWRQPEAILQRVPLVVYRRPGSEDDAEALRMGADVRFADAPLLEISSTDIRARVRGRRSIRYLVPEPVRRYIDVHGLYRG